MPTKKELYNLTKEMLFAKFDGLCAFCGYELGPRWCIWYIEPQKTIVTHKGQVILGDDSYENKLPACASCNGTRIVASDKHNKISIEDFRLRLNQDFSYMSEDADYRKAIRFGLIVETGQPVIFHFEKFL